MKNTIQVTVWERGSGTTVIPGTQFAHSNNHQHNRKRRNEGEVESTNGDGGGYDSSSISSGSTK
jgi:hypothetical protein